MRFEFLLLFAWAASSASAFVTFSLPFSSSHQDISDRIYKSWSDSRLSTWLSDHDVKLSQKNSHKAMLETVENNWNKVKHGYEDFDEDQIREWVKYYLSDVFPEEFIAKADKDDLVTEIKNAWYGTEDRLDEAKQFVFDSWANSQLRKFLDANKITSPAPKSSTAEATRKALLDTAYKNYHKLAKKYSKDNNWLYKTWSNAELKAWLDSHGVPTYQGSSRNELIASIRRASRSGKLRMEKGIHDTEAKAKFAGEQIRKVSVDNWKDSSLRAFLKARGIDTPPYTKREQLVKQVNSIMQRDNVWRSINYFTSPVGIHFPINPWNILNFFTSPLGIRFPLGASNSFTSRVRDFKYDLYSTWSDSSLRTFLSDHGVQSAKLTTREELLRAVREANEKLNNEIKQAKDKIMEVTSGVSTKSLKEWSRKNGVKISDSAAKNRENIVKAISSKYEELLRKSNKKADEFIKSIERVRKWALNEWEDNELRDFVLTFQKEAPKTRNELLIFAQSFKRHHLPVTWGFSDYFQDAVEQVSGAGDRVKGLVKGST